MNRKKGEPRRSQCAYCGAVGQVDREHIFAKVLFRVLDPQMITVPACKACNRKKSLGDRDLRNYLTLHVAGSTHPDAMWHAERMVNSNVRTRLWVQRMIETAKKRPLVDEHGLVLGQALENDFNKERFIESIKLSVRGLYFHHTGRMLPPECPVAVKEIVWSDVFTFIEKVAAIPGEIYERGTDVVWWKLLIDPSGGTDSTWVLGFNDAVLFYASTGDAATRLQAHLDSTHAAEEVAEPVRNMLLPDQVRPLRIPRSADDQLYIPEQ